MSEFFAAAREHKHERQDAILRAFGGLPPDPEPEADATSNVPGFDGGARQTPPPPAPSHNETLIALVRSRQADTGARFEP